MYAEAYLRGQNRVVSFVTGRDPEVAVPACPDWTALDVMRHLAGDSADIVASRMDGFASEEWTQHQIDERSGSSFADVVGEWNDSAADAASVLDNISDLGLPPSIRSALGPMPPSVVPAMVISDLLHHEFDLRNAYGDRGGRDVMDIHFAAAGHAKALRPIFSGKGLDAIRIESTDSGMGWDIGRDTPVAIMRASSFQLMRAIGGRRTKAEVRAMGWEGDPEPFLDSVVLPHLAMRETSLAE